MSLQGYLPYSLAVLAYFLGAIPTALIVSRSRGIDLRSIGSGNIGATNVYRAMGFKWALLVFLLDLLKGFIPTYLAMRLFPDTPVLHIVMGGIAILAHTYTIFAGFKGGRGAATGLGLLLAISPNTFGILAILAFMIIRLTRYVSVATITCASLAPLLLYFQAAPFEYISVVSAVCIFIIFRHKSNISRLINGTENKV